MLTPKQPTSPSYDDLLSRIRQINRLGGSDSITGVFYALSEDRISPGKATQVLRHFLLTGEIEPYKEAEGESIHEEKLWQLQAEIEMLKAKLKEVENANT